ncbi:MSMEG_0570 family nitrogen starvation response protein [Nocardioides sp. SOB77]|uniref:MSMEG_0570 family nitrogen starvation response protein n=1 Tax=Nocardioides oceani TaxID=3058369 RepID=A0ABT8FCI5_9ACTN|nr:MSMEG_0570 family nitrogen starvation response protein [Nocardioides oceani]MDN4171882.1 MSMEG_0570 family nitrogen starvation response protein [Nocardioides oceani]
MTFTVRWPDGRVEECYSPSLVVHDHLAAGTTYSVRDFTARSTTAMAVASERVREKFGFACTSAAATVAQIERSAAAHAPDDLVEVLALQPPLPGEGR